MKYFFISLTGQRTQQELDNKLYEKCSKITKEVVRQLAIQLVEDYGKNFESRNLRRMMQFAELFPDIEKVSPLVTQLSWTHFMEILPVKNIEARINYMQKAAELSQRNWVAEALGTTVNTYLHKLELHGKINQQQNTHWRYSFVDRSK